MKLQQMYDGPPLPKEQVGIIRSGCIEGGGLTIMATQSTEKTLSTAAAILRCYPGNTNWN